VKMFRTNDTVVRDTASSQTTKIVLLFWSKIKNHFFVLHLQIELSAK